MRNGGGGAQIGKRRLMKYDSGSAAPFDTTHTRHFERWQGNWIRRETQATENPVTRFPSGGSMISESVLKIATAAMRREIFLVNACDGVTTRYAAGSVESAAL